MLPAHLMEEIASDEVLEEAYRWLCDRRKNCSPNNDVWNLRWRWQGIKPELQARLVGGSYRFEPLYRIPESEDNVELWTARDSLVLKAMTIVLTRHLAPLIPKTCYHLLGNGGAKRAVCDVVRQLPGNAFVFRSDVRGYYASIDHEILVDQLRRHVADERVIELVRQYLGRTIYDQGRYEDVKQGIAWGCSLSPLLGAVYLAPLDERMARAGVFYARFMDDWVVLARSRWKLRAAVRTINRALAELKVKLHPKKTFVGLVSRGFDFLGYRISPAGIVGLAGRTVQNCVDRINRLYEQGAETLRIGQYFRDWWTWVESGIACGFVGDFQGEYAAVVGACPYIPLYRVESRAGDPRRRADHRQHAYPQHERKDKSAGLGNRYRSREALHVPKIKRLARVGRTYNKIVARKRTRSEQASCDRCRSHRIRGQDWVRRDHAPLHQRVIQVITHLRDNGFGGQP